MENKSNVLSFETLKQNNVSEQKDNAMNKLKERMKLRKLATEQSNHEVRHETGMEF